MLHSLINPSSWQPNYELTPQNLSQWSQPMSAFPVSNLREKLLLLCHLSDHFPITWSTRSSNTEVPLVSAVKCQAKLHPRLFLVLPELNWKHSSNKNG